MFIWNLVWFLWLNHDFFVLVHAWNKLKYNRLIKITFDSVFAANAQLKAYLHGLRIFAHRQSILHWILMPRGSYYHTDFKQFSSQLQWMYATLSKIRWIVVLKRINEHIAFVTSKNKELNTNGSWPLLANKMLKPIAFQYVNVIYLVCHRQSANNLLKSASTRDACWGTDASNNNKWKKKTSHAHTIRQFFDRIFAIDLSRQAHEYVDSMHIK